MLQHRPSLKHQVTMLKLVVLFAFFAISVAAPSGLPVAETIASLTVPAVSKHIIAPAPVSVLKTAVIAEPSHVEISEPVVSKVGDIIESVPTAVSHQSSTVVHSKANIVTPVVAVNTITAPVLKTYASAPILKATSVSPVIGIGPIVRTVPAPLTIAAPSLTYTVAGSHAYATGPALKTIFGPPAISDSLNHGW